MVPDYFSDRSFQRRIKRRIKACQHHFVVKVPPAFARICASEIESLGFLDPKRTDSGIELTGSLADVYSLNLKLQTASRVLMEITSFKAGAREELFRKMVKISWELYFNPLLPLAVTARVRKSRLRHEGQTASTLYDAIAKRFTGMGIAPPPLYAQSNKPEPEPQAGKTGEEPLLNPAGIPGPELLPWASENTTVHQRLEISVIENKGRILMDTSGHHLHMRGYRERHGEAAIRETLAAGFIKWAFDSRQQMPAVIVDPMCGSGTLLIESRLHFSGIPPGLARVFLFTQLPWHQDKTWNHIRTSSLASAAQAMPRMIGSDISPETIAFAEANSALSVNSFEAIQTAKADSISGGGHGEITFRTADFLESGPELFGFDKPEDSETGPSGLDLPAELETPGGEKWIISNPPYGVRLEAGTRRFLKAVIRHLRDRYPGWSAALILPGRFASQNVIRNPALTVAATIRFTNGGIPVMGVVLKF